LWIAQLPLTVEDWVAVPDPYATLADLDFKPQSRRSA
jgi:hypothetical protein